MKALFVVSVMLGTVAGASALAQISESVREESTSILVNITIKKTCDILSSSDIEFGEHAPRSSNVATATGSIAVQCTNGTSFALGLDYGANSDGGTTRAMAGPNDEAGATRIAYSLYQDAVGGTAWGNEQDTRVSGMGTGLGGSDSQLQYPIYAQTTLSGTEPAGKYTDTVTATLTY